LENSRAARAKELPILTISAATATSVPTDEAPNQHAAPVATPRRRARRRNLTEAQKADLSRLYAETTTPVSEIKSRFGIAESSLSGFGASVRETSRRACRRPSANRM
jgi:hypothetical protein